MVRRFFTVVLLCVVMLVAGAVSQKNCPFVQGLLGGGCACACHCGSAKTCDCVDCGCCQSCLGHKLPGPCRAGNKCR